MTSNKTPRVLLIDDEKADAEVFQDYLKDDFQTEFRLGSEKIIDEISEQKMDVLVTDLLMPGKTGIEIAKWVKENRPEVKVFMNSSLDSKYSKELSADGVLHPDLSRGEVIKRIQTALEA